MHPFSTPWKHQKTLHFLMFSGGTERVHRKRMRYRGWKGHSGVCFYLKHSVGFWNTWTDAFTIWPDVFLNGRVFDLKTSGRVFSIKISWPSVLKHPAACLNFKHLATHFTNAFQIWSWNYFTSHPLVLIFSCFYNSRDFWVFEGHISTATVLEYQSINQNKYISLPNNKNTSIVITVFQWISIYTAAINCHINLKSCYVHLYNSTI